MAGDYPFRAGIAHFSTKTSVAQPGQPEGAEEAHMQWRKCITGPFWATWAQGESLAMRVTLTATIVALSAACGRTEHFQPPAAPTAPPPTFALTGTVMEVREGVRSPARNIAVEISPTHQAVTDSAGHFSIPGLAEGAYVLRVRDMFYEPLSTTVRIQGDTRIDLEIVALPVYALSGIVYEDTEDGPIPVPGVFVNNAEIHSSARTDEAGAYRVLALRGVAQISFSKSGYVDHARVVVMEGDVRLDVKLVHR